jgi:hypothetical protein
MPEGYVTLLAASRPGDEVAAKLAAYRDEQERLTGVRPTARQAALDSGEEPLRAVVFPDAPRLTGWERAGQIIVPGE